MSVGIALRFAGFSLAHRRAQGDLVLLDKVDLEIAAGSFCLLVGESGSGKSSLLRLLTGLVSAREWAPRIGGVLEVLGVRVGSSFPNTLRRRVVALLQDEGLLDELTPRQNVELALWAVGRSKKLGPALLAQVGLDPVPDQVALLSGGMRKRLGVARALATNPELLVCDEPTSGLDAEAASEIAHLLRLSHDAAGGARTTLVITHDLSAFEEWADEVVVLDQERKTLVRADHPTAFEVARVPIAEEGGAQIAMGFERVMLAWGAFGNVLWESVVRLPPVFPGSCLRSVVRHVLEPLPFVVACSSAIGGLATFFALRNNPLEGAFQGAVLTGAGKVLVAVLVPLLSGFFFTARMAAGAAARIGTMQRTQQIAGLQMLGLRPTDYLLTPLVWGMTIAMPVVALASIVGASFASLILAEATSASGSEGWALAFFRTVDHYDIRTILLKTMLSGYLIAVVTWFLGSGPKRSGDDVGRSVNASIVWGMAVVLVVHSVITYLQFS